jgi:hypothetical protein
MHLCPPFFRNFRFQDYNKRRYKLVVSPPRPFLLVRFAPWQVLWECLTGQVPWEGLHSGQVVGAVGFQGRTLPQPHGADPFLSALSARCMAADPADRPTFGEIVSGLEEQYLPNHMASMHSTLSANVLPQAQGNLLRIMDAPAAARAGSGGIDEVATTKATSAFADAASSSLPFAAVQASWSSETAPSSGPPSGSELVPRPMPSSGRWPFVTLPSSGGSGGGMEKAASGADAANPIQIHPADSISAQSPFAHLPPFSAEGLPAPTETPGLAAAAVPRPPSPAPSTASGDAPGDADAVTGEGHHFLPLTGLDHNIADARLDGRLNVVAGPGWDTKEAVIALEDYVPWSRGGQVRTTRNSDGWTPPPQQQVSLEVPSCPSSADAEMKCAALGRKLTEEEALALALDSAQL